jgi:hypothetical protein
LEQGARRRIPTEALDALLAAEAVDRSGFSYDFDAWHLGAIATGVGAEGLLNRLAESLDRELLLGGGEEATTGWWGARRAFEQVELEKISAAAVDHDGLLALGEPGRGLTGWRATHRQARAAYGFAARASHTFSRYGVVALLAAVVADPDLADFLRATFLTPLCSPSLRDCDLPAALRAYLDARGHMSEAAAALHVDRGTLVIRIRMIEERIGRPLHQCLAELDLALRCQAVEDASPLD